MSRLEISIVTYNNDDSIAACLDSVLAETRAANAAITVVDNASSDGTVRTIHSRFPAVEVLGSDKNVGFGAAHNRVLERTAADRVLLLNPDARLASGAVSRLAAALDREPDVAMVGPRLENEDGRPEVSFGEFPGVLADTRQRRRVRAIARDDRTALKRLEDDLAAPFRPDWISGACLLARVEPLRNVGLFDPRFFLYLEDVDLCLRLRNAGYAVTVEPGARCVHATGGSQADPAAVRRNYRASRLLYEKKHGTRLGAFLYARLRG